MSTDFQPLANGMSTLWFYDESETNYVVQGSTELLTWLQLTINLVSSLGYLEFTHTASTDLARRFYRIGT